jgi:hypothetical protein
MATKVARVARIVVGRRGDSGLVRRSWSRAGLLPEDEERLVSTQDDGPLGGR